MIKENEIRIGNWFRHNNQWNYRSEAKCDFEFQFNANDWYQIGECCLWLENMEPIPLTEEWLLRFGFLKDERKYGGVLDTTSFWKSGIELKPIVNGTRFRLDFKSDCLIDINLDYVHQLQNLSFALTGEELILSEAKQEINGKNS